MCLSVYVLFVMATPVSVVTRTTDLITAMFRSSESWLTVAPNAEDAATAAPSSTGGFHSVTNGVPDGIRQLLEDQLLLTLKQYVINNLHLEATVQ